LGITIVKKVVSDKIEITSSSNVSQKSLKNIVVLGCDHTGYTVKNLLAKILVEKGFSIQDVGTFDETSCDYPDFAFAAAKKVKSGEADFGILVDATGIPSAITANKIKGIRAATCYNEFTAKSAREHNNANVLVIGAKALGEETIKGILETWLTTNFGGGRHQRRLDKITEIENQNL
jgi:ribose 5-phosphate isomerase B